MTQLDKAELAKRVEAGEESNELDMLIEIALFKPSARWMSVRPNNAGTKLIYTSRAGNEETFWAWDWTLGRQKAETIKSLTGEREHHWSDV